VSGRVDIAVLGRVHEVETVAAGAASVLASGARERAAVVARAGGGRPRRLAPPTRGAARLRDRLSARGLEPAASGRVVWSAADSPRELSSAAVGAPVVLAVCCSREPWLEPLLDEARLVLVAGSCGEAVVELALEELRARAIPCAPAPVPEGAASLLARSGLWSGASLRELVEREAVPA
jgi:hypothetical protein